MTRKIFQAIFAVAIVVLLASMIVIIGVLSPYFGNEYYDSLKAEAIYTATGMHSSGTEFLQTVSAEVTDTRITLVDSEGNVLYDNRVNPSTMENHADREEIREAMLTGTGLSTRYSDTLDEKAVNYAVKLDDGSILRMSGTQFSMWALMKNVLQMIFIVVLLAVIMSSLLAYRLSRKIVSPLNEIDFERPEDAEDLKDYEEIKPLLQKLHLQNRMLQNEMKEREKMRREFTANVSHELKTPLTSISGFAEIMRDGLVRQEDISRFSGNIYTESQRLIRLVEDIIRLSELDEEEFVSEFQEVDLSEIVDSVIFTLMPEARRNDITIQADTEQVNVSGIHQILMEMIYNLCDNAVKYNQPGGSVSITLKRQEQCVLLSIRDTGIGIPPEEQSRIFERFYRVDKSHSKEVGGTGLGLAIVKHAASIHNAQIEMDSDVGKGTEILIRFPVEKENKDIGDKSEADK